MSAAISRASRPGLQRRPAAGGTTFLQDTVTAAQADHKNKLAGGVDLAADKPKALVEALQAELNDVKDVAAMAAKLRADEHLATFTDTAKHADGDVKDRQKELDDAENKLKEIRAKIAAIDTHGRTLQDVEAELNRQVQDLADAQRAAERRLQESGVERGERLNKDATTSRAEAAQAQETRKQNDAKAADLHGKLQE